MLALELTFCIVGVLASCVFLGAMVWHYFTFVR